MIRAAAGDPQSLAGAVRRELHAIDPTAPELRMASLEAAVRDYASQQRFTTILFAAFAVIVWRWPPPGCTASCGIGASRTGRSVSACLGSTAWEVLRLVLGRAARAAAAVWWPEWRVRLRSER